MRTSPINKYTAVEGAASYVIAVLFYFIFALVFGFIMNVAKGSDVGEAWVNFAFSAIVEVCFVVACIIPCKVFHSRATYAPKKTTVGKCLVAVLIGVLCYACFSGIGLAFNEALFAGGYQRDTSTFGVTSLVLTAVSAIIFAPIGEELLFRGAVLSSLSVVGKSRVREGNHFVAVIVTALLFAFMHVNPLQTVYQFLLGVALGFAVVKMGSVLPAIIIHAVSNTIGIVFCVPAVDGAVSLWLSQVFAAGWSAAVFVVVSVALAAAGAVAIYFLCRGCAEKRPTGGEIICDLSAKERGGTSSAWIMVVPGALICLAQWIVTFVTKMGAV